MNLSEYIYDKKSPVFLKCKVIPNSKKNEIIWFLDNGILKIKMTWIPEKWTVNKNMLLFLKTEIWLVKNIELISWSKSNYKTIKIDF